MPLIQPPRVEVAYSPPAHRPVKTARASLQISVGRMTCTRRRTPACSSALGGISTSVRALIISTSRTHLVHSTRHRLSPLAPAADISTPRYPPVRTCCVSTTRPGSRLGQPRAKAVAARWRGRCAARRPSPPSIRTRIRTHEEALCARVCWCQFTRAPPRRPAPYQARAMNQTPCAAACRTTRRPESITSTITSTLSNVRAPAEKHTTRTCRAMST